MSSCEGGPDVGRRLRARLVPGLATEGRARLLQRVPSLVFCSDFYRNHEYTKLGLASPEDTIRFLGFFRQRDANDLLATLWTWQHADISANELYSGDIGAALGAIRAKVVVMPSETDFLFSVGDNELEVRQIPNAQLRAIPSRWGHVAGFGTNPSDNEFIDAALHDLLSVTGLSD